MRLIPYDEFCTPEFRAAWKALLHSQAVYDIGNTYEWNRCWWESYRDVGPWRKQWFVLAHESEGKIRGIAPFVIRQRFGIRIVEFLGQSGGFMTDFSGLIVAPGNRDALIRELYGFLLEERACWDLLLLPLPAWRGELSSFIAAACLQGVAGRVQWTTGVGSYYVDLELRGDFDEYLASLGKKTRVHLRQYLRAAERAGAAFLEIRGSETVGYVEPLCRLNAENWNVLRNDRGRRFLRRAVEEAALDGEPALIGTFRVNGEPCGAFHGFESNGICFLHTAGVHRQQIAGMSPGTTMYALFIKSLIERGCHWFNMGPGVEEYKLRLGGAPQPIYQFQLTHSASRMARWNAFRWARDALHWAGKWGKRRERAAR